MSAFVRGAAIGRVMMLLVLPLVVGCTVAQEGQLDAELEASPVASSEQAILNGEVVTADTGGVAKVSLNSGTCTGTMLSDTFVLTAAHCVSPLIQVVGRPTIINVSVEVPGRGTVSATAKRFVVHPSFAWAAPFTPDVAIIELATPIRGADYASFSNPIYPGTNESLERKQLDCYGYGWNTLSSGAGVLRRASQTVSYAGHAVVYFTLPNAQGQARYEGDSGGPCFYTLNGTRYIAGVAMGARLNQAETEMIENTDIAAQSFRDWAHAVIGAGVGVYANASYTGQARALTPGSYSTLLATDNSISSVSVPSGWNVQLFDGQHSGASVIYVSSQPSLADFNDRASSAQVFGTPVLYNGADLAYGGDKLDVGRYDLTLPGNWIPNDSISSLNVPLGMSVTLFANPGFTGLSKTFYAGNIGYVGVNLDNATSSIIIRRL